MGRQLKSVIRIHQVEYVDPAELNPAVYNPNKMSPSEFEALKKSILNEGFVENLVVRKDGLEIISGHHRVRAVKELCVEHNEAVPKLPAILLDVSSETAKKLNLKLQHIKGSPDARMLGELLVDIYADERPTEEDVTLLGLDFDDVGKHIRLVDPDYFPSEDEPDKPSSFGGNPTLSLEFSDAKTRDAVKKVLTERASLQKKKSGNVIAELLSIKKRKNGRATATA